MVLLLERVEVLPLLEVSSSRDKEPKVAMTSLGRLEFRPGRDGVKGARMDRAASAGGLEGWDSGVSQNM